MCSYSWRVPLHAFGDLKIVASGDIGDLGPKEGTAINYYWNPLYNVAGALPWLLLIGAMVLFKENRCRQALWMLLPLAALKGLWTAIAAVMSLAGMPSEAAVLFGMLIDCLLIGFVLNWLLAERIGNRNRFATWLLAMGVFGLVLIASLASFGMEEETAMVAIFIGLTVAVLLISFTLAGFLCRKKFGPVRFSLWAALWVLVSTFGLFIVVAVIQAVIYNTSLLMMLTGIFIAAPIYAGILIVGLLPFEILLFKNAFWRKRFEAVFGLKTQATQTVETPQIHTESTME